MWLFLLVPIVLDEFGALLRLYFNPKVLTRDALKMISKIWRKAKLAANGPSGRLPSLAVLGVLPVALVDGQRAGRRVGGVDPARHPEMGQQLSVAGEVLFKHPPEVVGLFATGGVVSEEFGGGRHLVVAHLSKDGTSRHLTLANAPIGAPILMGNARLLSPSPRLPWTKGSPAERCTRTS